MPIIYPLSEKAYVAKYLPSYRLLDGGWVVAYSTPQAVKESVLPPQGPGTIWYGGGFQYTEVGMEASTPLVTAGGARLHLNLNRYELKAEALGIRFDGQASDATENATLLQGALDWLEAEGQGGRIELAPEGTMKIDRAIMCRNGVTIDGRGALTDNILDRSVTPGSTFGQDSCYLLGSFARLDDDNHEFHALQGFGPSSDEVVLNAAVSMSAFNRLDR